MFSLLIFLTTISQISLLTVTEERNSFINECGPYESQETDLNPSISDCINSNEKLNEENVKKCCYVEGYYNLQTRTTCVNVINSTEGRISMIEEFSSFSTGIKIECGQQKIFKSDCGNDNPEETSDCSKYKTDDYSCCFISIKSNQFTGNACRKFNHIDQNDIGEAVLAAKTIGASLIVDCYSHYIKFSSVFFLCFFLVFL